MTYNREDIIALIAQLGIKEPAAKYLLDTFDSPSREVASHPGTSRSLFTSFKTGLQFDLESLNESSYAFRIDRFEPDVAFWAPQAKALDVTYENPETGGTTRHPFYPDFLIVRKSGRVEIVDRQTRSTLHRQVCEKPHAYKWDIESDTFRCLPKEKAAESLGLVYRISVPTIEDEILKENLRFLVPYFHPRHSEITEETGSLFKILFTDTPWVTLQDVIDVGFTPRLPEIYAAIAHQHLYSSISQSPIREYAGYFLYKDHSASILHSQSIDSTPSIYRIQNRLRPKNGELLLINGIEFRVIENMGSTIKFVGADRQFHELPPVEFYKMEERGELVRPGHALRLAEKNYLRGYANTNPKDLIFGIRNTNILQEILAGNKCARDFDLSEYTINCWRRTAEEARLSGQSLPLALAPKHANKGNRNRKVPPEALAVATEAIVIHYKKSTAPSIFYVWGKYQEMCRDKNIKRISIATFYSHLKDIRLKEKTNQHRIGSRANYKDTSFKEDFGYTAYPEGNRPFEIAMMDSTQIDVICCSTMSGQPLQKPWLTILVDAYTKLIIAAVLMYEKPSYRTVMAIIRDCVRRHGWAPTVIRTDNAGEFTGSYVKDVVSQFVPYKESNPPAESRFNAFCERWFGRLNTAIFHNLPGNTKALRVRRTVTKGFAPQDHAWLTLADAYYQFEHFAQNIYGETFNPHLGKTPNEAMKTGLLLSGLGQLPKIEYDYNFILSTCPPVDRSGTRLYSPPRGVKFLSNWYSNSYLDRTLRSKERVRTVYDPFDISITYVFAKKAWHECVNRRLRRQFAFRTEAELEAITQEHRARHSKTAKGRELAAINIAHLLEKMLTDPAHESFIEEQRESLTLLNQIGLLGPSFNLRLNELAALPEIDVSPGEVDSTAPQEEVAEVSSSSKIFAELD